MPDPATASAALQNGEVDWWENPISDLVPLLQAQPQRRRSTSPIRSATSARFRMNHLHPPFNDVRARRAVLMALDQEEYMRALVGDDNNLWKPLPGYLHARHAALHRRRRRDPERASATSTAAKKLLAESGYTGQPVTCVVAQDQPITKAQGDVTAELLKRIGMNVDFVATDWGTDRPAPRAEDRRPARAAGRMFHTWHAGADCINPAVYIAIRANGDSAWFGWPNVPQVETEVDRLVRGQERSTRRRRPIGASEQGRARQRGVCADRLLPRAIRRGARTSAAS